MKTLATMTSTILAILTIVAGGCGEQPNANDARRADGGLEGMVPDQRADDDVVQATADAETAPDSALSPEADGAGSADAALPVMPDGAVAGTVIVDDPNSPRTWPAGHGEALISLWQDDKLASMAITIDDNTAPDQPWWLTQGKTYGLRFTWFIITQNVGTAWGGSWAGYQNLVGEGHDVQSHTVTHLQAVAAGTMTIEGEYHDSKEAIETNLPGVRVLTLAYPGGTNSYLNDDGIAAKYYIGARGVVGKDNPAVGMSYMRTNSISGKFILQTDHWAGIPNLITFNPAHPKSFRGFHCIHYHQVGDKPAAIAGLTYLQAHEADLWVGLFREVMLYGQERDAATLTVPHVSADRIILSLTDTLDDSTFDHPLTLKVGLASSWKAATATQSGIAVSVQVVQHGAQPFALISAVPDRGFIELLRK